ESAPFLFVHSDGKSGLTGEIVFLPDTTRQRSIRPYATWASNDATLMFTNGVLTQAKEDVDQTQVAAAALDGLTKVLSTAGLNAIEEKRAQKVLAAPPPYLFKIVVNGSTVTLKGGPPENITILLPNASDPPEVNTK